jgi:hypothetical protein
MTAQKDSSKQQFSDFARAIEAQSPTGSKPVFAVIEGTPRSAVFTFTGCALESVRTVLEDGIQDGLTPEYCTMLAMMVRQVEAALCSVGAVD